MNKYALSIAGFDPSAGAGVLADIKTFENLGIYGFGISSAITYQSDNEFLGLQWIELPEIIQQLKPLSKFPVAAVKIGIIKDFTTLIKLTSEIRSIWNDVKIVWDPVLAASAGYVFHDDFDLFEMAAANVDLVTPNFLEACKLFQTDSLSELASNIEFNAAMLVKGIKKDSLVYDCLIQDRKLNYLQQSIKEYYPKHGSGCVFSSAITAVLTKHDNLIDACKFGQLYISQYLASSKELLGFHNGIQI